MIEIATAIKIIQQWFVSNCDGDWEHQYGLQLGTLDNPGWDLSLDLTETDLENVEEFKVLENTGEEDWFHIMVQETAGAKKFSCAGDAHKLERVFCETAKWIQSGGKPLKNRIC